MKNTKTRVILVGDFNINKGHKIINRYRKKLIFNFTCN